MSNSQEQSLDENVVFLPVTESSPEFLHCEKERQAVERLLSEGPEAFYSSIGTERAGCFLSSEEVSQITSWAQDFRFSPQHLQRPENGEGYTGDVIDFCSTYFPSCSDIPTPELELGWPERSPWVPQGSITVHTNPPSEGQPPVREIIRQHLQRASQVIAIVTDRLTDGAIIGDLHNAATRGVPVYIILNQKSIQENFTLNRLRHPNMQVRILGGKTFCSRTGRMVVGELKDKFVLVDLVTVIHGSYSLTWTDAHLHRQLITVLCGPVVESFDREFRILFAASLPISDTWKVVGTHVDVTHALKDFSHFGIQKQFSLENEINNPPSPPTESLLDWEAMGVIQRDTLILDNPFDKHEHMAAPEIPLENNKMCLSKPMVDGFPNNSKCLERKKSMDDVQNLRVSQDIAPVTNHVPDKSTPFRPCNNTNPMKNHVIDKSTSLRDAAYLHSNTEHSPTDQRPPDRMKRVEREIEKAVSRQLSSEKNRKFEEIPRIKDKETEQTKTMVTPSSIKRRERLGRDTIVEERSSSNERSPKVENTPSSRKPLILMVPQSESFSSLSEIMKRIQLRESASGQINRRSKGPASEMSQSMQDLSVPNGNSEEREVPVPRFKASCFDPGQTSPGASLRNRWSEDMKPLLYRNPQNFMPRERPRSSSYALKMDWRRSLAEMKSDQEF